jgi:sulfide:quinone oxidoreductase
MKKILILGGGTAGLIVANKLARELRNKIAKDQVEIIILDKSNTAINKAGFTFVPFGYLI